MVDRHYLRRTRAAALAILLVGFAVTAFVGWRQSIGNDAHTRERLEEEASRVARRLTARFQTFEYGLRGARGVVVASDHGMVGREAFARYMRSRDLAVEFPGARGYGLIQRVPVADEAAFVAAARADGRPDFAVRQLEPHDGERWVILYIEPLAENTQAVGLDIASERVRRAAAREAAQSGHATLTAPITLVQAAGHGQRGFLLLLPIYRPDLPLDTPEQREAAVTAWSYAPLIIDEVLARAELEQDWFQLTLSDAGSSDTFYGGDEDEPPDADATVDATGAPLGTSIRRTLFGREWQIDLRARPRFVQELNLPSISEIVAAGAISTVLLAGLVYAFLLSRRRAMQVRATRAQLGTIVESSSDAIIGATLDGVITAWNKAAEALFGYRADEAIGRPLDVLLIPEDKHAERQALFARAARGQGTAPIDTIRRRKDGALVEVSLAVSPIVNASGTVEGIGATLRSIADRKAQERQLQRFSAALERQVDDRTAALEAARRDLQTILDAIPSMVGYWDRNVVNRFANLTYHRWLGVDPGHIPGMHMRQLLGDALYDLNRPHIEAALRGEPQTFERSVPRVDASGLRHILVQYVPDVIEREVRGFYVMIHDITELTESRKRLDVAVRENAALLSILNQHALVTETDARGFIIDVNDAFCRVSGFAREELIGNSHRVMSSGTHPPSMWADMWATIGAGKPWRGEICNRRKDGSLFWTDNIIAPFYGADGRIERYVAIRTDVTDSKAATRALAEERERLDNIIRGTHAGTWEWNVQTGETRFNERWADIVGLRLADLGPTTIDTWFALMHPTDLAAVGEHLKRHFDGELDAFVHESRVRHEDGHWVWVLERGRVSTWTHDGKPEWMHGIRQDISESRDAQRRLAESEEFLERAGHIAGVGGWQVDLATNEVTWTREMRRIHGLPDDYVPTREKSQLMYPPEVRPMIAQAVEAAFTSGEGWDLELPYVTPSGRRVWVRAVGELHRDDNGKPLRLVGALQDITGRRQADEALRRAMSAAEAASAAKSEFLANMSHEIRTPLNAVIGLSYLLEQTELDDEQRAFVAKIQLASRSLLGVINDVLDLSKIEAGEMALEDEPFELASLLRELEQMMTPQAMAKGLRLIVRAQSDVPGSLRGDVTRLRQVLTNLLSNALKFTERGEVELAVRAVEVGSTRVMLRFCVRDTGIGIAPDVQERLFAPFTQADPSTTRRFGGTGLGLSIVRRLSHLMGGEVSVRSEVGAGSEFTVHLPLAVARDDIGELRSGPKPLEILVATDDEQQRDALLSAARALGWRAEAVPGIERLVARALDRARSASPIDAVICDARIVPSEGAAAAEVITQKLPSAPGAPGPAVIMVGQGPVTRPPAKAAKADGFVTTPITGSALFNAVNTAVAKKGGDHAKVVQATRLDAAGVLWLPDVRVLVVDDSEINLQVARNILEREGAVVTLARHGLEAVERLRAGPTDFDAVLMDVQMPVMDGHEASRRVRAELKLARLPILALTAGALLAERQRALDAGMDEFISKPLDPQGLIRILRQHVERARGTELPVKPRKGGPTRRSQRVLVPTTRTTPAGGNSVPQHAAPPAAQVVQELVSWPRIDGIDQVAATELLGDDVGLFLTMLEQMLRDYGDLVRLPVTANADEDTRKKVGARAHKLRGSAGMLGAIEVHRLAGEGEQVLRDPALAGEAPRVFAALAQALQALSDAARPVINEHLAEIQRTSARLAPHSASPAPFDPQALTALSDLLARQDFAALDAFKVLTPMLRSALGEDRFTRLGQAVNGLQFRLAASLLAEVMG